MIKLIATDIDGTILIPEGKFRPTVKECIKNLQKSGIKVVLVTGRMNQAATIIKSELELDTPVVSYQGGLIKDGKNTLYERYISESHVESIIKWAKCENIHLNLYNNDTLYTESDNEIIQRYCNIQHVNYIVRPFSQIKKNKVNKILAIDYNNAERINKYEKEAPEIFPDLYIVKSTPYFLEFSNPEGSKYCAVKFLQKYWSITPEETMTIGDQNNDIALLEAGGLKIAMGNATEELKAVADYVTDTVYNDGFIKAVDKFVLNQNTI